jgi:hypothetical protein
MVCGELIDQAQNEKQVKRIAIVELWYNPGSQPGYML